MHPITHNLQAYVSNHVTPEGMSTSFLQAYWSGGAISVYFTEGVDLVDCLFQGNSGEAGGYLGNTFT